MFCGLEDLGRKKGKKLIATKSGLIGMKEYLKAYDHVKYFLPYLKPFLIETAFSLNFRGDFWVLKPKSND